jgi:hypothetical protein
MFGTPSPASGQLSGLGSTPGTLVFTPSGLAAADYNGSKLKADATSVDNPSETGDDEIPIHVKVAAPNLGNVKVELTMYVPSSPTTYGNAGSPRYYNYVGSSGGYWKWAHADPWSTVTHHLWISQTGAAHIAFCIGTAYGTGPTNNVSGLSIDFSTGDISGNVPQWNAYTGTNGFPQNALIIAFGPNVY